MPHVYFRNVNDAFREMVRSFNPENAQEGRLFIETNSRAGKVRQLVEPCIATYRYPRQRVLFNKARDANPFFHLFEALWMLAGKNDVATLSYYSSGISDIASDDGETFNGAYGYRWRNAYGGYQWKAGSDGMSDGITRQDQLQLLIKQLKEKPNSRRCVLQMWNVEDDLLKIDVTKDVCCNTAAYFSIRRVCNTLPDYHDQSEGYWTNYLDMTVTNRSNDLVWGMLGANYVHFSILQEYLAAHIGVEVGKYHQFTNNLHVYLERFKYKEWGQDNTPDWYSHKGENLNVPLFPLVSNPKRFDDELYTFVENVLAKKHIDSFIFHEPFFARVALPMAQAFNCYKTKNWDEALHHCKYVEAWDWRTAAIDWLTKRRERWLSQNPYNPSGVEE